MLAWYLPHTNLLLVSHNNFYHIRLFFSYFNYITQLINDTDVKPHKYFLSINGLSMEPVPLFNRARFVFHSLLKLLLRHENQQTFRNKTNGTPYTNMQICLTSTRDLCVFQERL